MDGLSEADSHVLLIKHCIVLLEEVETQDPIVPAGCVRHLDDALSEAIHRNIARAWDSILDAIDLERQFREVIVTEQVALALDDRHADVARAAVSVGRLEQGEDLHELSLWHDDVGCPAVHDCLVVREVDVLVVVGEAVELDRPVGGACVVVPDQVTLCE